MVVEMDEEKEEEKKTYPIEALFGDTVHTP